jgi:hypothetical protein
MRWKELLEFERLFARNIFDIKDEKNGPMIKADSWQDSFLTYLHMNPLKHERI